MEKSKSKTRSANSTKPTGMSKISDARTSCFNPTLVGSLMSESDCGHQFSYAISDMIGSVSLDKFTLSNEVILLSMKPISQSSIPAGALWNVDTSGANISHSPMAIFAYMAALSAKNPNIFRLDDGSPMVPITSCDHSDIIMQPLLISDVDYDRWAVDHYVLPKGNQRHPTPRWSDQSVTQSESDYLHYIWREKFMKEATADKKGVGDAKYVPNAFKALHPDATALLKDITTGCELDNYITRAIQLRPMTNLMLHKFLHSAHISYSERSF